MSPRPNLGVEDACVGKTQATRPERRSTLSFRLAPLTGALALSVGVTLLPAVAHAAPATRHKVPFQCGETWSGTSRSGHSPSKKAVDFNRAGDLGAPVVASAAGIVKIAQATPKGGYGRLVEIDHGNGESSVYAHLDRVDVVAGQRIDTGAMLGTVGSSGRVSGPHLHFEEKKGKKIVKAWFEGGKFVWGRVASANCVDVPLAGRFLGGPASQPAVYRRGVTSTFNIRVSETDTRVLRLGKAMDEPVVGDWNGDGTTDIGVRRPKNGKFYLKVGTAKPTKFKYGLPSDLPVAGDWDGNGTSEVGLYRPATGQFLLRGADGSTTVVALGSTSSLPVTGDWDGDRVTDVGVYDQATGVFTTRTVVNGVPVFTSTPFASPGDLPVVGDWDGNGTTDLGSWVPGSAAFTMAQPTVPGTQTSRSTQLTFGRPRR